ncbi:MAG: PASTA domain-containing protein [Candidatus Babeliales bacterium]
MKLLKRIFPYAWLAPFVCFFTGYYLADRLFTTASFTCPTLVGMPLYEACTLTHRYDLNLRIIQTVVDDQKPAHTIINQKPSAGEHIKAKQTVFCTLSCLSSTQLAPSYEGQKKDTINEDLKKNSIKGKFHRIPYRSIPDMCIGQTPTTGTPIPVQGIDLYITQSVPTLVIMPNLTHITAQEAKNILAQQSLAPLLVHDVAVNSTHLCTNCIVTAQRPAQGTVINLSQAPNIQLLVHDSTHDYLIE